MTELTVWPARRVGERYLCGRTVNGRSVCQGEIATVDPMNPDGSAMYERGMVDQDDPGRWPDNLGIQDATGILHLREHTRRRKKRRGYDESGMWPAARLPFTRKCPHCGSINRVG
ncbi:MAG TPA: hypothetical protein VFW95_09785 [Candidatus Limnocylindria bacterium]|nr:hypothetical protein [Candidatus Limnocylindria bacterium]